jgi:hypothetical protein
MENKERIKLWVDALRSGEYTQGHGALLRDGNYCCLGVACEVAMQNGAPITKQRYGDTDAYEYGDVMQYSTALLPHTVIEWYGFPSPSPAIRYGDHLFTALYLNDAVNESFATIADAIENTYLKENDNG